MPNPMLPAVDELANLRRTLAELRQREFELCDEICAGATEMGATRIDGGTRTAIIETRAPRLLDLSKLPDDILSDPKMFSTTPQMHILLWPKANSVGTVISDPTTNALEDIVKEPNELGDTSATVQAPDEVFETPQMETFEVSENTHNNSADMLCNVNVTSENLALNTESDIAIDVPVFDIADKDALLPSLEIPSLDAHKIAETAEETDPPVDLLATQHTDLQPMGDLTEEDLETAYYESDQDLPSAVDADAVLSTEALQTDFDMRVEAPEIFENDEPAPFVTRRIIGAPA